MGKDKYYDVKSEFNTYRCRIKNLDLYETIFFGGTKRCVVLTVHIEDNICHIDGAGWHAYCNKEGNMPRSAKGTIDMIKTCIQFVFTKYPKIKHVTLVDTSKIECNDGTEVSLGLHYIVKYGKTWYEKNFGVRLEDPKEALQYSEFLKSLKKSPMPFDFEEFDKRFLQNSYMKPRHLQFIREALRPHYENSKSLSEFLNKVNNNYDCSIFQHWLYRFVKLYSGLNFNETYWTIDRSTWSGPIIITFERSKEPFDWSQFGGIPSHLMLRHGIE
jgi:hypothetical protein